MADNLFFTTGDAANDRRLQRQAAADKLRKLYAGVYSDNLVDPLHMVTARNAFPIAARLCGEAILSGRSALRGGPVITEQGGVRTVWLFLIDPRSNTRRAIGMPGLVIRSEPGAAQQDGDYSMLGLVMPSKARAVLDNLSPSRSRGTGPTRTAGAEEIETRLESVCAQEGEVGLNKLRDEARALAPALGLEKEFLDEIRSRHADLMASRPECLPGKWKVNTNVAGNTTFVAPSKVEGTLRAGFEMLGGLSSPFAKAVFIHFLLADVHPFTDGNGRMARLMMAKELVGSRQSRIIVPTVYRDDYINGMRVLTKFGDPGPIVRALDFCQKVTAACSSSDITSAVETWASTFAFVEAGANARLEMPSRARKVVWQGEIPAPEAYWRAENADGLPFGF